MRHDAVLVGAGTARADDPDLTVRDLGAAHQPVRIVADTRLALSPDSRLGRSAGAHPVWLCHGPEAPALAREAWTARGARLIGCAVAPDGRVDAGDALRQLAGAGLTRILCEGGGQLAAALIRAGLVTEVVAYAAGKLIGQEGRAALGPLGLMRLDSAPSFDLAETARLGDDVMTRWTRRA
jgi:diaminohydroxyphosphoribosylaminopyrimidine deaminase/5-amino-6-(5-phosphoribosylamino)uracil reductase